MYRFKNNYRMQLILTVGLLCVGISMVGCQANKLKRMYTFPYYEATIDDIPSVEEIRAVLITEGASPWTYENLLLVGDRTEVEQLVGHEIWLQYASNDRQALERLVMYFKKAERNEKMPRKRLDSSVIFITDTKAYVVPVNLLGETMFGFDWQSDRTMRLLDDIVSKVKESKRKDLESRSAPQPLPELEPGSLGEMPF
jgi:hypothetical protein